MTSLVLTDNSGVRSTAMPPKLTSATKQIREAGAVVHACAHLVLGDRTSKRYFGNRNFSTIKLQGVVVSFTDGKTKPNDWAQWTLNVLQHCRDGWYTQRGDESEYISKQLPVRRDSYWRKEYYCGSHGKERW